MHNKLNHSTRAADSVISTLEARILRGELTDGTPLPAERQLIEEFGVSRTVVREAIQTLAARGFVDARPRFRPVIRRPTIHTALSALEGIVQHLLHQKEGVKHLFETRIVVESGLVRMAALQADKNDIARLKNALALNAAAVEDSQLFYETDLAFHAIFYEIPRNPVFPALHHAYVGWLKNHWLQMPRLPARNLENVKAHSAITEAILARDPDAAELALREHLQAAWEQVRATFEETDGRY
jgi:DNA-binding FadR family transcriptional regulator